MNRMRPTWLSMLSSVSESFGKTAPDVWGAAQPSNDGPSRMPAAISAITMGWRMRRARRPMRREALMMSSAWTMKRASCPWRSSLIVCARPAAARPWAR